MPWRIRCRRETRRDALSGCRVLEAHSDDELHIVQDTNAAGKFIAVDRSSQVTVSQRSHRDRLQTISSCSCLRNQPSHTKARLVQSTSLLIYTVSALICFLSVLQHQSIQSPARISPRLPESPCSQPAGSTSSTVLGASTARVFGRTESSSGRR